MQQKQDPNKARKQQGQQQKEYPQLWIPWKFLNQRKEA